MSRIPKWRVQIKGDKCSSSWEISVVREDYEHGQLSWGWFDHRKLLISHNGGPCSWPIIEEVWSIQIGCAQVICDRLNSGALSAPTPSADFTGSPR